MNSSVFPADSKVDLLVSTMSASVFLGLVITLKLYIGYLDLPTIGKCALLYLFIVSETIALLSTDLELLSFGKL